MNITLSKEVLALFPEASVHCLVVENLSQLTGVEVEPWFLKTAQNIAARQLNTEFLTNEAEVKEWRDAYRKFGVKPSDYPSAIEALLRRAVKGKLIKTGIPAVDLYCYVSLIARSPMGAYDIDKLQGNLYIRTAKEGEKFHAIGEQTTWATKEGMVVYADESRVLCWAWNHRDSQHSCLDATTRRAIFFADSSVASSRESAEQAVTLLEEGLSNHCTVQRRFILDSTNPILQF